MGMKGLIMANVCEINHKAIISKYHIKFGAMPWHSKTLVSIGHAADYSMKDNYKTEKVDIYCMAALLMAGFKGLQPLLCVDMKRHYSIIKQEMWLLQNN